MVRRIAVGAMCYTPVESRVERVDRVLKDFHAAGFAVKRFDSDGDFTCGENARRAWAWASEAGRYSMVIADDAEPCKDAAWAIDQLTRLRQNDVMTFMDWTGASEQAKKDNSHWLVGRGIYGPASLMPSSWAKEMLSWLEPRLLHGVWIPNGDDYTIGVWLKHGRAKPTKVYTPVPCLFQHAEPSSSTLGHSNKTRVCRWFVDNDRVWDIDWRHGFTDPTKTQSVPYDPESAKKWIRF